MSSDTTASTIHRSGTVALVGRPNVGKSTLLNAALQQPLAIVTPTPQTTRDRILGVIRHGEAQIAMLDTPGLHKPHSRLGRAMNYIAKETAAEADVVVYLLAIPERNRKHLELDPRDVRALESIQSSRERLVIAVNKIDLLRAKSKMLPLLESIQQKFSPAAVVPISAKQRDGLDDLLDEVARLLPARGAAYDEDFLTDRPIRFFVSEYVREQVIRATRQEVPHHVAVTIEGFDELPEIVRIRATIRCARPSQKAIIIGAGGQRLKAIGTAARRRIEELLEKHVHLALWVSTDEGWPDSPEALSSLGYATSESGSIDDGGEAR